MKDESEKYGKLTKSEKPMIRKRVYLNKPQAEGLIQIFRRNQLLDLLVYVAIYNKNKSPHYKLCIDCPIDTHPRLSNKLQDVLHTLVDKHRDALQKLEWEEYDDAETPIETLGLTPDFKEYVKGKEKENE